MREYALALAIVISAAIGWAAYTSAHRDTAIASEKMFQEARLTYAVAHRYVVTASGSDAREVYVLDQQTGKTRACGTYDDTGNGKPVTYCVVAREVDPR
ncbi:MAG: hypothetical protein ACK56C_05090 [Alphaproteobacteria bacterium]